MSSLFAINWSSFIPDLIVGVVTGAVVGLALYIYESKTSERRRREEARAVSRRIVQPMLLVLQRPDFEHEYQRLTPLPRKLVRAIGLIEGSDLDHWHDIEPTDLTRRLLRFRSAAWDLREDAQDLEEAIRRWARLHAEHERSAEYATALVLDAPHQYLHEAFPDEHKRADIATEAESLIASHFVKLHARKYRKASGRVERAKESLIEVLVEHIRAISQGARSAEQKSATTQAVSGSNGRPSTRNSPE